MRLRRDVTLWRLYMWLQSYVFFFKQPHILGTKKPSSAKNPRASAPRALSFSFPASLSSARLCALCVFACVQSLLQTYRKADFQKTYGLKKFPRWEYFRPVWSSIIVKGWHELIEVLQVKIGWDFSSTHFVISRFKAAFFGLGSKKCPYIFSFCIYIRLSVKKKLFACHSAACDFLLAHIYLYFDLDIRTMCAIYA